MNFKTEILDHVCLYMCKKGILCHKGACEKRVKLRKTLVMSEGGLTRWLVSSNRGILNEWYYRIFQLNSSRL